MKILGIAGSLRKDSFNKKLLAALARLRPAEAQYEEGSIDLPLFNQDDELERYPEAARKLKEQIRAADAVIIASPEYNRSIPGPLKNAFDWTDRPDGEGAWVGKPVLIAGASGGMIGTAVAHYDIAKVLLRMGAKIPNIEIMLGKFKERFDEAGNITDPKTEEVLKKNVGEFLAFVSSAR